jgi:poly-gamma-glutamate synthesis protein (capsule biosynthesis protein)
MYCRLIEERYQVVVTILLVLLATLGALYLLLRSTSREAILIDLIGQPITPVDSTDMDSSYTASGLWLTGDVMLSRQVAEYMVKEGAVYPWKRLSGVMPNGDFLLINFEACLSDGKQFNAGSSMRFPVATSAALVLGSVRVSHVSLANNHALDCGQNDLEVSRQWFKEAGIDPIGHPTALSTSTSLSVVAVGGIRVAIVAIHTLFGTPELKVLKSVLTEASTRSDFQLVYVHWGDEYLDKANESQSQLAQTLAQAGADLIIGHHPHVVQDIEQVGSTTIVYSLGNFIFDQYFSTAVQEGLVVRLSFTPSAHLTLHPVTSRDSRVQPRFMTATETALFLSQLAERSDQRLHNGISQGLLPLTLSSPLATSGKPATITP